MRSGQVFQSHTVGRGLCFLSVALIGASSAATDAAQWCTDPTNTDVVISPHERRAHVLSSASKYRALYSARRCGFFRLQSALLPSLLRRIKREIERSSRAHPELLEPLRGSTEGSYADEDQRVQFSLPYRAPFNDQRVINSSLVMPLVTAWLQGRRYGVELHVAAHLLAGPRAPAQVPHTDVDAYHGPQDYVKNRVDSSILRTKRTYAQFVDGSLTFALNVHLPLKNITRQNGATVLCPGSHLLQLQGRRISFANYTSSKHCTGPNRVYGTGRIGDILVYDSRLVHWAGANPTEQERGLLSYSYCQSWLEHFNQGRQWDREARWHYKQWRQAWRNSDGMHRNGGTLEHNDL